MTRSSAAEQLGGRRGQRKGLLRLEMDPKYCDVIIQRWQALSGPHATLEGDGRTFEQIKTARLEVAT